MTVGKLIATSLTGMRPHQNRNLLTVITNGCQQRWVVLVHGIEPVSNKRPINQGRVNFDHRLAGLNLGLQFRSQLGDLLQ